MDIRCPPKYTSNFCPSASRLYTDFCALSFGIGFVGQENWLRQDHWSGGID
jgi:hypothetical protein